MSNIQRTHSLDFDLVQCERIVAKVRDNRIYAQNLYAALCNNIWQEEDVWQVLRDHSWSCSWRRAGSIVADILGTGDYLDWYCSGMMTSHPDDDLGIASYKTDQGMIGEGTVTAEIQHDLAQLGWRLIEQAK